MSEITPRFHRVMVIDDNQIDLYIATKLMMSRHFSEHVLPFTSAIAALDFLVEHQDAPHELPQIIFVDIHMPLMSGFEFLEAFDKLPATLKTLCRIFVVSSSIDENDIERVKGTRNVEGLGTKTITVDFLKSISIPPSQLTTD